MKRKIIITIDNNKVDYKQALEKVLEIINEGKISTDGKGRKQYCWATRYKNMLYHTTDFVVSNRGNKGKNTESFLII